MFKKMEIHSYGWTSHGQAHTAPIPVNLNLTVNFGGHPDVAGTQPQTAWHGWQTTSDAAQLYAASGGGGYQQRQQPPDSYGTYLPYLHPIATIARSGASNVDGTLRLSVGTDETARTTSAIVHPSVQVRSRTAVAQPRTFELFPLEAGPSRAVQRRSSSHSSSNSGGRRLSRERSGEQPAARARASPQQLDLTLTLGLKNSSSTNFDKVTICGNSILVEVPGPPPLGGTNAIKNF